MAGGRLVRPVLLGELLTGAAQLNFGAARAGRERVVVVGVVVADGSTASRSCRAAPTMFHSTVPSGAAVRVGRAGVGAVVGDVERVGRRVDADPERVAEAHRVDLGPGLRGARREEVAGRDGVRAVGLAGGSAAPCRAGRWCCRRCAGRRSPAGRAARRSGCSRRTRTGWCCRRWPGRGCRRCRRSCVPPAWQQVLRWVVDLEQDLLAGRGRCVSPVTVNRDSWLRAPPSFGA